MLDPQIQALVVSTVLFFTTTNPTNIVVPPSPNAIPTFQSLTEQQRLTLPDSTKVMVGNNVTTLGQLRLEHSTVAARIANAAALGNAARQAVSNVKPIQVSVAGGAIIGKLPYHVVEPPQTYAKMAQDMQNFCNAAQATVCLYYPAGAGLISNTPSAGEASYTDAFITDPSVCQSEGGVLTTNGCQYSYILYYAVNFNPGSGFTYQIACDSQYWGVIVDKHGAISVGTVTSGYFNTPANNPATCVIQVYVTP